VIGQFYKVWLTYGEDKEAIPVLLNGLDAIEAELVARNTPFFGGRSAHYG